MSSFILRPSQVIRWMTFLLNQFVFNWSLFANWKFVVGLYFWLIIANESIISFPNRNTYFVFCFRHSRSMQNIWFFFTIGAKDISNCLSSPAMKWKRYIGLSRYGFCSMSSTFDIADFETPPVKGHFGQLWTINDMILIVGAGIIHWTVHNYVGNEAIICVPGYYIPTSTQRLLSLQNYA